MTEITIDPERYADITLDIGHHRSREHGTCLMEAVAYLAGEKHSDQPKCVSLALGGFGRGLNDALPMDLRQELKWLIPSLPGTGGDGSDLVRSYMVLDWLVRTWLPAWLDLAPGYHENARYIRKLSRIVDKPSSDAAYLVVREVWRKCDAWTGTACWSFANESVGRAAWGTSIMCADLATTVWEAGVSISGGLSRVVADVTVRELQLSAIDLFVEMIKNPR